jgi:hypothetical protein
VLAAQGASLGKIEYERPRTHGADPGHTAQEVLTLAPDRAGPQRRIKIVVENRQARIEPRDMGLDIRVEAARRTAEAILLRGPHGDELPPPGKKRPQFLRLRVRNRTELGANRVRKVGQAAGIQGIGLGSLASSLREIAGLPWVDDHDGQGGSRQRGHHGALEPTRRFEHHQRGAQPASLRDEVRDARVIVGHGPAGPGGTEGHIEMGLGHINTYKNQR